jgi:membrane-bound lytic murein transglycosylase D
LKQWTAKIEELNAAPPPLPKKPAWVPKPAKPDDDFHIVQPAETLYRIAMKYNLSVEALRRLNNLSENQFIYPGQKLRVRPRE